MADAGVDADSFESLARFARVDSLYTLHRKMAALVPAGTIVPPLLDPDRCNFRRSPHTHQIRGVAMCMQYLFSNSPEDFVNLDETADMKTLYASIAADAERNVNDDADAGEPRPSKAPRPPPPPPLAAGAAARMAHVACVEPVPRPRGCKISIPCGGGKTAMLILLAIMHGGNCLIVTNNAENALQILKTIVRETNIHQFVAVRLVKPNSKSERVPTAAAARKRKFNTPAPPDDANDAAREEAAALDRLVVGEDIRCDGNPTRRHFLPNGGAHGITILDVNAFKEVPNACTQRNVLRRFIFQSFWNLVQFDESDAVSTADMRTAMDEGLHMDFDDGDGLGNVRRRIPLRAEHQVFWSGTWFRGDDAGREWLYKRGPMLFRKRAVDLQEANLLANVRVCIVVCDDPASWSAPFEASQQQLRGLTAEKCRVLQQLMLLHQLHGHKMMLFSRYLSQLGMLEKMLPTAFVVKGGTRNRDELDDEFRSEDGAVRLTTNVGERGLDMRDVSVVFDAEGYGDSPSKQFQRMGRCMRIAEGQMQSWYYGLISSVDQAWCDPTNPASILQAARYEILRLEGYLPQMSVVMSKDIPEMVLKSLQASVIGLPAGMPLPSIAYDDAVVQTNHVLCFFLAVQCKDPTVFDPPSASKATTKKVSKVNDAAKLRAKLFKLINTRAAIATNLLVEDSKARRAAAQPRGAAASTSTAMTATSSGGASGRPPMPTYMLSHVTCQRIQGILAASPCEHVRDDTPEMQPCDLWALVCEIRDEAEATMKRVDAERTDIRKQIREFHSMSTGDESVLVEKLHDQCKFLFEH